MRDRVHETAVRAVDRAYRARIASREVFEGGLCPPVRAASVHVPSDVLGGRDVPALVRDCDEVMSCKLGRLRDEWSRNGSVGGSMSTLGTEGRACVRRPCVNGSRSPCESACDVRRSLLVARGRLPGAPGETADQPPDPGRLRRRLRARLGVAVSLRPALLGAGRTDQAMMSRPGSASASRRCWRIASAAWLVDHRTPGPFGDGEYVACAPPRFWPGFEPDFRGNSDTVDAGQTAGCRVCAAEDVEWFAPAESKPSRAEEKSVAARGTTFAKQERDRAKKAKAALKRERREARDSKPPSHRLRSPTVVG